MPAFKDVGNVAIAPGASLMATAKFWEQDITRVHPMQLDAFIVRHREIGMKDQAATAVAFAVKEILWAQQAGQIGPVPITQDPKALHRLLRGE